MIIINIDELKKSIKTGALVIDVRNKEEYDQNHLDGSINIKYDHILSNIKKYTNNLDQKIILYCSNGTRSRIAKQLLLDFGYTNVIDIGKVNL